MNRNDAKVVLNFLVPTKLWSALQNLSRYKRLVVDANSIVTFLYSFCIKKHQSRHKSLNKGESMPHCSTLINYGEFSKYVEHFLDFLVNKRIEPLLVYEGKQLEAPLFGLKAAQFESCYSNVVDQVNRLSNQTANNLDEISIEAPSLALNIFKSVVNKRRRAGAMIHVFQAFYSCFPVMTRLARDFECPVLTNNAEFILMDVRAGFILFRDLWLNHIDRRDSQTTKALGSTSRSGQKSKEQTGPVCFHYNLFFLRQHPGLSAALAVNLFPLTSRDFMLKYSKSLKRLHVYQSEFNKRNLTYGGSKPLDMKQASTELHQSANRFEQAITFLAGKTHGELGNKVRGEATRINASFDVDYREIFNRFAVGYEFRSRLRLILKYVDDVNQLNYIEWCLVNRECTAAYLLDLLCCSIGHLASVNYGSPINFEDPATKHSSYSMKNRSKQLLMSLMSENKEHKGETSISSKNETGSQPTRYSSATLTVIDRQTTTVIEHVLGTRHDESQIEQLHDKLALAKLVRHKANVQDCAHFINITFKSKDLRKLPSNIEVAISRVIGKDEQVSHELAVALALFKYSRQAASTDDGYFEQNYSKLVKHLEIAILNHYLYIKQNSSKSKSSQLAPLLDLVNRSHFEHVAVHQSKSDRTHSPKPSSKSSITSSTGKQSHDKSFGRQIRHLIELLCSSFEAYLELNAFLNYPLPKLNLSLHFNPILIYNLASYSCSKPADKILVKF